MTGNALPGLQRRLYIGILFLICIGIVVILALGGSDFIVYSGRFILQDDVITDYVVGILWALTIWVSIYIWPVPAGDRELLRLGWTARCLVTLIAMLFYESYYEIDAFGYFYNARALGFEWSALKLGSGVETVTSILGIHQFLYANSYHMMKVSCSLAGLIAIYLFYRGAVRFLGRKDPALFYSLALFPSVIFWSSILGKDPMMLLCIAIYASAVVAWHHTNRSRYIWLTAIGIVCSMYIRPWMGVILLLPLTFFVWARAKSFPARIVLSVLLVVGTLAAAQKFGGQKFDVYSGEGLLQTTQELSRAQLVGGSASKLNIQLDSPAAYAAFIPFGIFSALFRPLPGEVLNPFGSLAGLEGLLLVVLFLRAARRFRWSDLKDPIIRWASALVLVWAVSYSPISYQNLGAAVRYRLQILPALLLLLLFFNRNRSREAATAAVGHDATR